MGSSSASSSSPDPSPADSSPSDPRLPSPRSTPPPSRATRDQDLKIDAVPARRVDEQSPLLSPRSSERDAFIQPPPPDVALDEFQATKPLWYLVLLTISIGGLQLSWCVELSNGSPYLLSLGLSKSLMALVWVAGPLTGTLVQPYIGMLSDSCRLPWGKRKPFMLGGAFATACSLLFLSWAQEIVGGVLGLFGADPQSRGVRVVIIIFAVVWIYVLDVAINTVQASIRSFIVDCAPAHQQEAANGMASRIVGVGNILGYCAGYVDLPRHLGLLGRTQFQVLCAIASIGLCGTVVLSTSTVREKDPRKEGPAAKDRPGVLSFFSRIFASIKRLPPQIKKVCVVQFCAWIGFFPMLFYTSSFVGEIYMQPFLEEKPNMTPEELDRLYEEATRVGTFALLIFAITSLLTNLLLPFFIAPTYDSSPATISAPRGAPATFVGRDQGKSKLLARLVVPGLTLRRAWMLSHIIFAMSMFCTVLVRTVPAATALIGLVGITWALTLWAPWAIIGAEISRRDAITRAREQWTGRRGLSSASTLVDGEQHRLQKEEGVDQAGVILGIHNMAIASPQLLATLGSSFLFRLLQKPRGTPGDHSFAVVLAVGGIFTLAASWFSHNIEDRIPLPEGVAAVLGAGDQVPDEARDPQGRSFPDVFHPSVERIPLARTASPGAGLD